MENIYSLAFTDTQGAHVSLENYRGKVLLLVNTATRCGLAGQFAQLEDLHQTYKNRGLVVIGFPCNQFMGQEPETNEAMAGTCQRMFGVTFLLAAKIDVNGSRTHPVFAYLKEHSTSSFGKDIKWNFTKFLVSKDGQSIRRYAPKTAPRNLASNIEQLLSA